MAAKWANAFVLLIGVKLRLAHGSHGLGAAADSSLDDGKSPPHAPLVGASVSFLVQRFVHSCARQQASVGIGSARQRVLEGDLARSKAPY